MPANPAYGVYIPNVVFGKAAMPNIEDILILTAPRSHANLTPAHDQSDCSQRCPEFPQPCANRKVEGRVIMRPYRTGLHPWVAGAGQACAGKWYGRTIPATAWADNYLPLQHPPMFEHQPALTPARRRPEVENPASAKLPSSRTGPACQQRRSPPRLARPRGRSFLQAGVFNV